MTSARDQILGRIRASLGRKLASPVAPVPATARVQPRAAGPVTSEIALLFAEIEKLSGVARRIPGRAALASALADLVRTEEIRMATLWSTPDLRALDIAGVLTGLGVEIVPPQAGADRVAACDLGVTGADAALAETGTLVLRSSPDRPRVVSLLPRVHLAILRPAALQPDLHQVFAEVKDDGYCVLVSGPSRTADIELTVTLGVHGPKSLYVWLLND